MVATLHESGQSARPSGRSSASTVSTIQPADLDGDRERLIERQRTLLQPLGQRLPAEILHDQDVMPSWLPMAWRVQMCGWISLEMVASRSKAGQPVGVERERLGQHFERHVPVELRIAGLPNFTHPALANLGSDVIRTDLRAFA